MLSIVPTADTNIRRDPPSAGNVDSTEPCPRLDVNDPLLTVRTARRCVLSVTSNSHHFESNISLLKVCGRIGVVLLCYGSTSSTSIELGDMGDGSDNNWEFPVRSSDRVKTPTDQTYSHKNFLVQSKATLKREMKILIEAGQPIHEGHTIEHHRLYPR